MSPKVPFRLRSLRTRVRVLRTARSLLKGDETVYVGARVAEYKRYWREAADALGAEFESLADDLWRVRLGGVQTRLRNFQTPFDDVVTLALAGDKAYCYRAASSVSVPVPAHAVFELAGMDLAKRFIDSNAGPFVVKPVRGSSSGLGITTHVRTHAQLERAACLASLLAGELLVEEMIFGESYRLLYLDGEFLDAVRRRGVHVVGDGSSSLGRLIEQSDSEAPGLDPTTAATIERQGLTTDSVIETGRDVLVRSLPPRESRSLELRTEYDERVTDLVCEDLRRAGARVVSAIEARFAGIDLITSDPTRALDGRGVFIELNTTPGIHHHYVAPLPEVPVAVPVLARLLGADEARNPVQRQSHTSRAGGIR